MHSAILALKQVETLRLQELNGHLVNIALLVPGSVASPASKNKAELTEEERMTFGLQMCMHVPNKHYISTYKQGPWKL